MLESIPEAAGQSSGANPGEVTRADTAENIISSVLLIKSYKRLLLARASLFISRSVQYINMLYEFGARRDCVTDE